MKSINLTKVYDYEGIKAVELTNEMAPLTLVVSKSGQFELALEIKTNHELESFEIEDFIDMSFENGTLKVELNTIDDTAEISFRKFSLEIGIPRQVDMKVINENLPLAIVDIEANLNLENENGPIVIKGFTGDMTVSSENGPLKVHNCKGNMSYNLENGPFSAAMITGERIAVESENGPIRIREAQFEKVDVTNENGVTYYETLPIEQGEFNFENENGVVNLNLPVNFDFVMDVETEYGSIKCKIDAEIEQDENKYTIRNGEGKTRISVKTENGSIRINSDGNINLDFIKNKLDQLKEDINNSKSFDDKEDIQKLMSSIIDYLNKNLNYINEEKVKESVKHAIDKLKQIVEEFDVEETKNKVTEAVEEISSKLYQDLNGIARQVKETIEREFPHEKFKMQFHEHMGNVFDKESFKKMFEPLKKMKHFHFDLNEKEKEQVSERSRIKILEMLEAGKITSEEAERLLKAIR